MSEKPTIRPSELKDINNSFCHIVAPAIELPIYVEDDPPFSIYIRPVFHLYIRWKYNINSL